MLLLALYSIRFFPLYVLQVCHITEVLCCGPCTKAARSGEGGTMGLLLAWDSAILSQLSEAHQAMLPAILTSK